jgi:nucleotide-binding universal stress UspA family protein
MVVLRFKDRTPREFLVPFNVLVGKIQVPIGLGLVFLVVLLSALANFVTKPVATISGLIFSAVFLGVFVVSERLNERRRRGAKHEHLDQFNRQVAQNITVESLGIGRPYRKLVAIRSPHNLFMLEKALAETDPDTTDVIVMTAKVTPRGAEVGINADSFDTYDQQLMTAVVERAERAGKKVKPLILLTNNPLDTILRTARDLGAQEVVMGASNKFTAEEQLDQLSFYWINLHAGRPPGLTVRILSQNRDVTFDVEGGNRVPRIGERKARSVAELRAAGVGVDRVLFVHSGTPACSDLFHSVLTMLDPLVALDVVALAPEDSPALGGQAAIEQDQALAARVGREIELHRLDGDIGTRLVQVAHDGSYDAIILALPEERSADPRCPWPAWTAFVLSHAHCPVFLIACPLVPQEVEA